MPVLVLLSPRLEPIRLSYTWNLNSLQDVSPFWTVGGAYGLWVELTDSRRGSVSWTCGTCLCVYRVLCLGSVCVSALTLQTCSLSWLQFARGRVCCRATLVSTFYAFRSCWSVTKAIVPKGYSNPRLIVDCAMLMVSMFECDSTRTAVCCELSLEET